MSLENDDKISEMCSSKNLERKIHINPEYCNSTKTKLMSEMLVILQQEK